MRIWSRWLTAAVLAAAAAYAFVVIVGPDRQDPAQTQTPAPATDPLRDDADGDRAQADDGSADSAARTPPGPPAQPALTPSPAPSPVPTPVWVDPESAGQPYGSEVDGLLTFRGNPTRTYYGQGPVPADPAILWRYPAAGALCGMSTVGQETRQWCGTGWTGQPAVFQRDGRTWVVFGAYDHQVHFLDADTGEALLPPFRTGDLVKGSVTVDPDGYPLVYTGSRDDYYRVLAIDRDVPEQLWALWAHDVSPTLWNNDWDGAGLILDDHLFVGGENSRLHIVRLNRGYDAEGRVTVDPQLIWDGPGWDDELLAAIGDRNVSIESSVTIVGDTMYAANSGGLVTGWDIGALRDGREPQRVFRFWTGDDTDATVVADSEGMLYVASEWERHTARAREVGQIMKLDPSRRDDPLVWSVHDRDAQVAGVWGTPALHRDVLYVPTNGGELLSIDRATGDVRWRLQLTGPTWQSPAVVDDTLIMGDCSGTLRAWDVRDTAREPDQLWSLEIGGCIESTPAVWKGRAYVGTRAGWILALAEDG